MGNSEQQVYIRGPNGEKAVVVGEYAVIEALRDGWSIDEEQPNGAQGIPISTVGGVRELSPREAERALMTTGASLATTAELAEQREKDIAEKAERLQRVNTGLMALLFILIVLHLLRWRFLNRGTNDQARR